MATLKNSTVAAAASAKLGAAAATTLSPGIRDYSEVFGRLGSLVDAAIPVLKIPVFEFDQENEASFDLGGVDYEEVFGRFDGWECAVSYEKLFGKSSGGEEEVEEEARVEIKTDTSLEKSCHSTLSTQSHEPSHDTDGRLSSSDHWTSYESKEIVLNTTDITRVDPGPVTHESAEVISLQKTEVHKPPKERFGETKEKDVKTTIMASQNGSVSKETFVTMSEINLRTPMSDLPPPSRPPPALDTRSENSTWLPPKPRGCKSRSYFFQGTPGLPTLNVEVDASSSAAVSAAATLEAMEKAQAKLNSAKEIMERKKDGFPIRLKSSHKNSVKENASTDSSIKSKKDDLVRMDAVQIKDTLVFDGDGRQNVSKTCQVISESREEKNANHAVHKFVMKLQRKGSWSCGDSIKYHGSNLVTDAVDFLKLASNDNTRNNVDHASSEMSRVPNGVHDCTRDGEYGIKSHEVNSQQITVVLGPGQDEHKKEKASGEAQTQEEHESEVCVAAHDENELLRSYDGEEKEEKCFGMDSWDKDDVLFEVLHKENRVDFQGEAEQEPTQKDNSVSKRRSTDGEISNNKVQNVNCQEVDGGKDDKDQKIENFAEQAGLKELELKEEARNREQTVNGVSSACDRKEKNETLKEHCRVDESFAMSENASEWRDLETFKVVSIDEDVEDLPFHADNGENKYQTISTPGKKCFIKNEAGPLNDQSEVDEMASFESPHLQFKHDKLSSTSGILPYEELLKSTLEFKKDDFDEDLVEKTIFITEEKNSTQDDSQHEEKQVTVENDFKKLNIDRNDLETSDVARYQTSQTIMTWAHIFSKSNDLKEVVTTDMVEELSFTEETEAHFDRAVSPDCRKFSAKSQIIGTTHLHMAENPNCHEHDRKLKQEHLRKLEKERDREQEKDRLIVDRTLSDAHNKGYGDPSERYVNIAVIRGTSECQQKPQVDWQPKEIQGESPLRRKARLERQSRTTERAAKALAEKNMRDLLVQKEQAERNRLADSLGAEVKRWATGKEGNLRALLSTLQYILGPDSGWKPIPLTDVITPIAVKKAYRKATLHVHPDKLQQRGASIQHKYICEKIFDLLKDAWNKFNSDQR